MSNTTISVRSKTLTFITFLAIGLLPFSTFAADPKIDLEVVSGINGYKLVFQNSECPSAPGQAGCVEVAKGSKNWIMWELSQEAVRAGWQLTALQLDLGRASSDTARACAVSDFKLDPSTGEALDFQVQGNGRMGKNWDENGCDEAYEIPYLLFAENPGMNESANSDPVIKNGGRL